LFVDWLGSYGVAFFILRDVQHPAFATLTTVIFWLESSFGIALSGGSFGQLATRLRVLRVDGGPLSLLRALQRQLLVCLVIPPLVFQQDGRGLHDLWTRSGAFELPAASPR
jgi:uncharacterized RDD family membrane protein YckC